MNWLFVLLDTVFSSLYMEHGWLETISGKLTSRTENIVYQIEAGTFDFHSVSRLLEHIGYLIPIIFALCLIVDFFIRSRFVRYSYRDEYQARKSVWWNWQSQQDAYTALEAGNSQAVLADHSEVDPNFKMAGTDTWMPEVQNPAPENAAAPADEAEADDEEDNIDRGLIENVRQNEMRRNAVISERLHNTMTDVKDNLTVMGSWFAFFPKAAQRRIAIGRKDRELRKIYAGTKPKVKRKPVLAERDEEAEAEAYFTQNLSVDAVDGDFEKVTPVETGGLNAYTFQTATQIVQDAVAAAQAKVEEPAVQQAEDEAEETNEEDSDLIQEDTAEEETSEPEEEQEEDEVQEEAQAEQEPEETAGEEESQEPEEKEELSQEETDAETEEEPADEEADEELIVEGVPQEEEIAEETEQEQPEEATFQNAAQIIRENTAE